MVEILTLFMWLTTGPQQVDVGAAGDVAAVEVRLDGETIQELDGEPWTFEHDFGAELRPRELVAIARDAQGREVDRTTRWINLGIGTVDAKIEFETDGAGRPHAARLSWESIGVRRPEAVEVTFDGEVLEFDDLRRIALPRYDPDDLHFITASLRFPGEQDVQLNASFGGLYGERVTTELTAVPVAVEKGGRLPRATELGAWFEKDGEPLEVHTVENDEAEVVVVRDPAAQPYFTAMNRLFSHAQSRGRSSMGGSGARRRVARQVNERLAFPKQTFTSFLSPFAVPLQREVVGPETFFSTPDLPAGEEGLLLLTRRHPATSFPLQLADAVALAGMFAQSTGHRRAVIVILGRDSGDRSRHSVAAVRAYLRDLRVPLHVWSTIGGGTHPQWGPVRYVGFPPNKEGSSAALDEAVKEVGRDLESQRIVWVRGRHLPQEIELTGAAMGVRLAGGSTEVEP